MDNVNNAKMNFIPFVMPLECAFLSRSVTILLVVCLYSSMENAFSFADICELTTLFCRHYRSCVCFELHSQMPNRNVDGYTGSSRG
jgi:hypothetical protein